MKEVRAYIRRHKLSDVTRALRKIQGITGLTIIETKGVGLGWKNEEGSPNSELPEYRLGYKLELLCHDNMTEEIMSVIAKSAHTGLKGDGKIYVSTIDKALRISTGERGEDVI